MRTTLIADHHRLVRDGIRRLLEAQTGPERCIEASDAEVLRVRLQREVADLLLLHPHLPPAGGLEALRRAQRLCPGLPVVVIGLSGFGPYPARLLELGALGLLGQGCDDAELLQAMSAVQRGEIYVSADLARSMVRSSATPGRTPLAELTPRELSVLKQISEGRRPREISDHLSISPKTVSTYRSRLCKKLGVRSDVELTHVSLEHGLIEAHYCL